MINSFRTYLTTGLIALILTGSLLFIETTAPFMRSINLKGRDFFFRLHHALFPSPPEANKIVLVNVDDETLRHFQLRWPYPRSIYGQMIERLKPWSPKAIGIDLIFSGTDYSPESDSAFAKALEEAGNVVIASHQTPEGEVGPLSSIRQSAWQVGVVDKPRDRDRVIRRTFLSFPMAGKQYPSWELVLFKKAMPEAETQNFPMGSSVAINYRLKFNELPQVSFWQLLEGNIPEKEIRNKIILVGLTAEAFHDIHFTPIGSMPGLAVNANVLTMLMDHSFFSIVPRRLTAVLTFLSLWLAILVAISNPFGLVFLAVSLLVLTYLAVSFLLFSSQLILDLWLVALEIIVTMAGTIAFREGQLFFENLKLREETIRDPLTGFYNRRFLVLKLNSEFKRLILKRGWAKSGRGISVVMVDLDNFKLVNDSFGHAEGDRVLSTMAEVVRSSTRKGELICRYGGDEFCVILPDISIQDAARFAEKIRGAIANNPDLVYRTAGNVDTIRVTASIGVASISGMKATEPNKLLKAADRALYRAKSGGRNQVCVFDPVRDVIT